MGSRDRAGRSAAARFARGFAAPLGVVLATVLFQLPFFDRWFSFMDEGHILPFADMIADGGELYRDATLYPLPGAFYLLALVFRLVEPSNLVARWIMAVEFAVFVGLVFSLLRRIVTPGWAWAGVFVMLLYRIWAFPHWHMYSYSTTALLVQLGALLLLLRYTDGGGRGWLYAAGLVFGLGVLCKQDYGAAALLALILTLVVATLSDRTASLLRPPVAVLAFLAPAVLVGIATAVHFLRQGVFEDFIRFTVLNHFVGMARYDYTAFPSFLPIFQQDPQLRDSFGESAYMPPIVYIADLLALRQGTLYNESAFYDTSMKLFYYAPYALLVFGAVRLRRLRRRLDDPGERRQTLAEVGLYALAALLILLVNLNRPQDYVHLAVLYWPLLCLCVVYARDFWARGGVLVRLTALLLILPVGVATAYTIRLAYRLRVSQSVPLETERAGILVEPGEARMLDDLVAFLRERTEPDERVAVMPYFPILHFYADRLGPHRSSYIVWPFPELPDRDRQVIGAMEADRTRVLIYNFNQFAVFERAGSYAGQLFEYLVDHYQVSRVYSSAVYGYSLGVALREEPRPDAGDLLLPEGGAYDLSIRSGKAPPQPVPPDERDAHLERGLWPFRRVIQLRPTLDARTTLSVPLVPGRGARLRTAIAIHPSEWDQDPPVAVRFELAVWDGAERQVLFARTLRPTPDFEDRGWFEVDVALDPWSGRRVELQLSTQTDHPSGEQLLFGGWELPRVVAPGGDAG